MRKLVALFLHLPGLRLIYGAKASPGLLKTNVKAVAITLALMALVGMTSSPSNQLTAVFLVWVVGHLAWGVYLATMA